MFYFDICMVNLQRICKNNTRKTHILFIQICQLTACFICFIIQEEERERQKEKQTWMKGKEMQTFSESFESSLSALSPFTPKYLNVYSEH